jgi:hypothetical protein
MAKALSILRLAWQKIKLPDFVKARVGKLSARLPRCGYSSQVEKFIQSHGGESQPVSAREKYLHQVFHACPAPIV